MWECACGNHPEEGMMRMVIFWYTPMKHLWKDIYEPIEDEL
jgi:hypothetical protein